MLLNCKQSMFAEMAETNNQETLSRSKKNNQNVFPQEPSLIADN